MAASNYMTELDTESIWDTLLDTARFALIGVRIAEILNFEINSNATEQVVDTAVTPILEQLSEEGLFRLIAAAKLNAVINPWDFVQANVISVMNQIIQENQYMINRIKEVLTKFYHYTETDRYSYSLGEGGLIRRTV